MEGERRFIETTEFPVREINEKSKKEKGPARPPYWEMVFYWTRKPLIGSRAVIAGSLLPEDIDPEKFKEMIRLIERDKKGRLVEVGTPHRQNPQIPLEWERYFRGKKLLDPFAGFGSIPLEGLRLGLDVTAVELLPTTYVFLKAVLDYPKKFGKALVRDVERWGDWITEQLKSDPEIRELYDEDVAVYIGTWEIKCPHCGRWTPAIGNYWLARVKDSSGYKRLAYMVPERNGDEVEIRVIDLNDVFGDVSKAEIVKVKHEKTVIRVDVVFEGEEFVKKAEDAVKGGKLKENDFRIEDRKITITVPNSLKSTPLYRDLKSIIKSENLVFDEKEDYEAEKIVITVRNWNESLKEKLFELSKKVKDIKITAEDVKVVFNVPLTNIESKRSQLTCLACGNVIKYADEEGRHYTERRKGSNEFYVKFALRKYHEEDERFARQRLLVKVKVKDRDLIFEPASREDNERLWKAKEKVKELLERKDPDVPVESLPLYDNRNVWVVSWGFFKWMHMFNPRQLLTLIKIVRLIREVGKRVEEEKLKEGWSEEKAFEYAEAIATYLSMAMLKYAYYNSVVTRWDSTWWKIGETMSTRGIAMNWNWTESPWFGEFGGLVKTLPALSRGLNYLTTALSPPQKSLVGEGSVKVLQGDATSLNLGEKFDVIVTDPPYADDVPYTELSDFYYVWLKRALSDSDGRKLIPRFHRSAFFEEIGPEWIEIETQWQKFAKKEVSTNPGRFMNEKNKKEKAVKHFEDLFSRAFIAMSEHLKEDGILVTYYAHTNPESWINLLNAGWRRAGLKITRAIPLRTEMSGNIKIVNQGKMSLDTSIVAVWKKTRKGGKAQISRLSKELEKRATESARNLLRHGYQKLDLLYGVLASVLEVITEYDEIHSFKGALSTREVLEKYVYPITVLGIVNAIAENRKTTAKAISKEGLFYVTYKILFGNATLPASDIVLLTLSTSTKTNDLIKLKILKKTNNGLLLYSPDTLRELTKTGMQKLLRDRGVLNKNGEIIEPKHKEKNDEDESKNKKKEENKQKIKRPNTIDILHLLEYYSLFEKGRFMENLENLNVRWGAKVNEAITLARLIVSYYETVCSKNPSIKKCETTFNKVLKEEKAFDIILMRRLLERLGDVI